MPLSSKLEDFNTAAHFNAFSVILRSCNLSFITEIIDSFASINSFASIDQSVMNLQSFSFELQVKGTPIAILKLKDVKIDWKKDEIRRIEGDSLELHIFYN